jgi:hypothetical protein
MAHTEFVERKNAFALHADRAQRLVLARHQEIGLVRLERLAVVRHFRVKPGAQAHLTVVDPLTRGLGEKRPEFPLDIDIAFKIKSRESWKTASGSRKAKDDTCGIYSFTEVSQAVRKITNQKY